MTLERSRCSSSRFKQAGLFWGSTDIGICCGTRRDPTGPGDRRFSIGGARGIENTDYLGLGLMFSMVFATSLLPIRHRAMRMNIRRPHINPKAGIWIYGVQNQVSNRHPESASKTVSNAPEVGTHLRGLSKTAV